MSGSPELSLHQTEVRDFIADTVVTALNAVANSVKKKFPDYETSVEHKPADKDFLGEATLSIINPDNTRMRFIVSVVAVQHGSTHTRSLMRLSPALVNGKLVTSTTVEPFGPAELGVDGWFSMITPKHVQTYVRRCFDEVQGVIATKGI
jgi:hypothetical protein